MSKAVRLLGVIAMTIGFTALYVRASDPAGRFGLFAFTLVVANMIAQAAWMWSDLFLTSALAQNSPGVLDGTIDSPRIGVGLAARRNQTAGRAAVPIVNPVPA